MFNEESMALDIVELLNKNKIPNKMVLVAPSVDINFGTGAFQKDFQILIDEKDFEEANALLEKDAEWMVDKVDPEYYLFAFTKQELYEILVKPDEWGTFDYQLAFKILREKGENIDKSTIDKMRLERLEKLKQPDKGSPEWIYFGYFTVLLGGLLAIFIGWHLLNGKKTLPNGQRVVRYNTLERKHGRIIFWLGLFVFPIVLLYRLYALMDQGNWFDGMVF